ncbi:MAG: NAD(P)/FAD-dependent oxidoreductase [Deltaproteobacteria bacterium]|nr:NAD(P)/FAD-dependent oxidoreductase [Deltaproteobacteria bacterium]
MEHLWDLAIIGAGAAGLAAAIFAGETALAASHPLRIALLDSAPTIGAKILISGGGRCNVTHDEVHPEDFNGSRNIVRNVLAAFDEQATIRWFTSLGVPLKREETGKLFPVSNSARPVLDALLRRCSELGITMLTQHRVREISLNRAASPHPVPLPQGERGPEGENAFLVRHERGELTARRVIMATGGRSLPRTGSDGSGWSIVRRLGHTVRGTALQLFSWTAFRAARCALRCHSQDTPPRLCRQSAGRAFSGSSRPGPASHPHARSSDGAEPVVTRTTAQAGPQTDRLPAPGRARTRLEFRRSHGWRRPAPGNRLSHHGLAQSAQAVSDWGNARLRRTHRWVQFPMGLGNGISGGKSGSNSLPPSTQCLVLSTGM